MLKGKIYTFVRAPLNKFSIRVGFIGKRFAKNIWQITCSPWMHSVCTALNVKERSQCTKLQARFPMHPLKFLALQSAYNCSFVPPSYLQLTASTQYLPMSFPECIAVVFKCATNLLCQYSSEFNIHIQHTPLLDVTSVNNRISIYIVFSNWC